MAFIITFEKYHRWVGEPLIHATRDVGQWMLCLPWLAVIVQWEDPTGGWMVVPKPTRKEDAELQALLKTLDAPQG